MTVVSASIPNHLGEAATLPNVSRGDVRTPIARASRLFGAGAEPAAVGGVVIQLCLERLENRHVQIVRERPIVPRRYTSSGTKMFRGHCSEPSRTVIVREYFE